MKVFKIITKTLRMVMRSKTSLAAVLLGPLLIITLVGLAFGNISQYSLNIGVFATDYDELVESYIAAIEDDTTYQVSRYPLIDNCKNDIRRGSTHTCIEFPPDFSIGANGSNEIKFYVDQSKTDMVEIIRNVVIERLSQRTAEISEEITGDVLSRVQAVDDIISEQAVVIQDMSSKLRSVEDDLSEAQNGFEYLRGLISGSDGNWGTMLGITEDMYDYADSISSGAYDAIDIGQSLVGDSNSSEYTDLEDIRDDIDDLMNGTHESREEMRDLIADNRGDSDDIDDEIDSLEGGISSAKDSVGETISMLTGMSSEFARASDDFAGIDTTENMTAPVRTVLEPVVAERAPLSYMFPTLLVMVIMLVSVMLAGTLVVVEKTSSSFFRNFVTPTSDMAFISGIFFSNIIVTFAQSLLIILVASLVFGGVMLSNLLTITVALLIISALFTLLGMLLGYLFNTQEMVSLSGITLSSLFIMLSGIIIPLEQMPDYMIDYTVYNPLLMGEGILRRAIIFQTELINEAIMRDVFLIIGFSLVLLALVIITQKIKKEVFLNGSNIFRKRKVSEDDQKEEKNEEKKEKKGLDFLEDYVGVEKDPGKKGKTFAKVKSRLASTKFIGGIVSRLKPKNEDDEIVYTGDEEMTYGSDDAGYENMGSSEDDDDADDDAARDDADMDDEDDDRTKSKGKGSGGSSGSPKSKRSSATAKKKASKSSTKDTKSSSRSSQSSDQSSSSKAKRGAKEKDPMLTEKLEPYQYFVLSSGVIIKSFPSLIEELESMDEDTFEYHVGDDRNDFYLWIKNVLKQAKAAEKIRKVKDPRKMAKVLRRFQ